jgi:hypothetical protein
MTLEMLVTDTFGEDRVRDCICHTSIHFGIKKKTAIQFEFSAQNRLVLSPVHRKNEFFH